MVCLSIYTVSLSDGGSHHRLGWVIVLNVCLIPLPVPFLFISWSMVWVIWVFDFIVVASLFFSWLRYAMIMLLLRHWIVYQLHLIIYLCRVYLFMFLHSFIAVLSISIRYRLWGEECLYSFRWRNSNAWSYWIKDGLIFTPVDAISCIESKVLTWDRQIYSECVNTAVSVWNLALFVIINQKFKS
jgi:hypothetical protein